MGYFVEEFKKRIRSQSFNCTQEQAEVLIKSYLSNDDRFMILSDLAKKEHLLKALKVLMAKRLGLDVNSVRFVITTQGKNVGASVLRNKGDGTFDIAINEVNINLIDVDSFFIAILHEFGHIDLMLKESRGEIVPEALFTDSLQREKLNGWQNLGYLFKYSSDPNEYYANMFAFNCVREFVEKYGKQCHKSVSIRKLRKKCNIEEFSTALAYVEAKILRAGWVGISKVLRIKEADCSAYEPCSSGFIEIAMSINQILEAEGLRDSEQEAVIYLAHVNRILKDCKENNEPAPDYNESAKMVYTSYCCMLLAGVLGLEKDQLSQCYDNNQEEKIKFINTAKFRKNSPLYGYFCYNKEFFENCDMGELVDVLTAEIDNVKQGYSLTNDNQM